MSAIDCNRALYVPWHGPPSGPWNPSLQAQCCFEVLALVIVCVFGGQLEQVEELDNPSLYEFLGHAITYTYKTASDKLQYRCRCQSNTQTGSFASTPSPRAQAGHMGRLR